MANAVIEALLFGLKATIWLFVSIVQGIRETINWFIDRQNGIHRAFPVTSVFRLLVGAGVLIAFSIMMAGQ